VNKLVVLQSADRSLKRQAELWVLMSDFAHPSGLKTHSAKCQARTAETSGMTKIPRYALA